MTQFEVDSCIAMGNHVPKSDRPLQTLGSRFIDHLVLLQPRETLTEGLGRCPSLIRDQMARHIAACLDAQHQVEGHDIERIPIFREGLDGRRNVSPNAGAPLGELGKLGREEILIDPSSALALKPE